MYRFTQTEKWRDPWFRALAGAHKLVFFYLIENCNNAGFYEIDMETMQFQTGLKTEQIEGALKALERGIKKADGWLWVRTFLKHQKNDPLNPENPAHKQILRLIGEQTKRFGDIDEFREFVAPYKGLLSPIGIGKGIGKGKKGGAGGKKSAVESEDFKAFYAAYPRKKDRPAAWKAWQAQNPPLAECLAAIERCKAEWDDPKFIPYPGSWINARSWEDTGTDAGLLGAGETEAPAPLPLMQKRPSRQGIDPAEWAQFLAEDFAHVPHFATDPKMQPTTAPDVTVGLFHEWKGRQGSK